MSQETEYPIDAQYMYLANVVSFIFGKRGLIHLWQTWSHSSLANVVSFSAAAQKLFLHMHTRTQCPEGSFPLHNVAHALAHSTRTCLRTFTQTCKFVLYRIVAMPHCQRPQAKKASTRVPLLWAAQRARPAAPQQARPAPLPSVRTLAIAPCAQP